MKMRRADSSLDRHPRQPQRREAAAQSPIFARRVMKRRGLCAIIDASPENGCSFMPEPVVRFRGINKSYGRARVLRGIDLDVFEGQSLGLAGVNGAGKTTLIKCLLDFCALDAGTIDVQGVGHRRPKARARLAFLP